MHFHNAISHFSLHSLHKCIYTFERIRIIRTIRVQLINDHGSIGYNGLPTAPADKNDSSRTCESLSKGRRKQGCKREYRVSRESLSKGRRKQGCKREYRVSRDTKKARESSVVRDSRLHPPI